MAHFACDIFSPKCMLTALQHKINPGYQGPSEMREIEYGGM